jgi:hypothetical protein
MNIKHKHGISRTAQRLGTLLAGSSALIITLQSPVVAACYNYVKRTDISLPSGATWLITCTTGCVLQAGSWCKAVDGYEPPAPTVYFPCFASSTETGKWCDCEDTVYLKKQHTGTPYCYGTEGVPCTTGCKDWDPELSTETFTITDCIERTCSPS